MTRSNFAGKLSVVIGFRGRADGLYSPMPLARAVPVAHPMLASVGLIIAGTARNK
jgi:hypothetical protein